MNKTTTSGAVTEWGGLVAYVLLVVAGAVAALRSLDLLTGGYTSGLERLLALGLYGALVVFVTKAVVR